MKPSRLSLLLLLLSIPILSGCTILQRKGALLDRVRADAREAIPDGKWKTIDVVVTGKVSSTTIKGSDVSKQGETLTAGELHIRHSNPWIPLITIDATGYQPLTP